MADLVFNVSDMEFGAEEIQKINKVYQDNINEVTAVVTNKLENCGGIVLADFQDAYNTVFLPILQEGTDRIAAKAEELGIDAELLDDTKSRVRKFISNSH